jgi:NAD(P)H-hydrate epimerase
MVRELARRSPVATVLDADGLNAHAGALLELADRRAPTVLTPHAAELARLLETDSDAVERERLAHARLAAERSRAVVVLKGDDTLIVEPDGRTAVSRGDSPALATAGTGDVLTGTIAALLAQGLDAFTAAGAGVQLHAQAGREAARRQRAPEGVIASDVIAALPRARGGA